MTDLEHPDALVIDSDAPEAEGIEQIEQALAAYEDRESNLLPPAKKKRRRSTSPTARTLAECRRRGWIAGVVERHSPFPKPHGKKHDFLGVIDLIAVVPPSEDVECFARDAAGTICSSAENVTKGEHCCLHFEMEGEHRMVRTPGAILGIQATATAANHAHRRTKILAEPRARQWVESGGRLELWSWSQRVARTQDGSKAKRPRWTLRVEVFTPESWRST